MFAFVWCRIAVTTAESPSMTGNIFLRDGTKKFDLTFSATPRRFLFPLCACEYWWKRRKVSTTAKYWLPTNTIVFMLFISALSLKSMNQRWYQNRWHVVVGSANLTFDSCSQIVLRICVSKLVSKIVKMYLRCKREIYWIPTSFHQDNPLWNLKWVRFPNGQSTFLTRN